MAKDFPRLDKRRAAIGLHSRSLAASRSNRQTTRHATTGQASSEKVKVLPRYVESRPPDVQNLILYARLVFYFASENHTND